MDMVELSHKIAAKIHTADQQLLTVNETAGETMAAANLALMTDSVMKMASLMTRRRTLIECWEMATGRVWNPNG